MNSFQRIGGLGGARAARGFTLLEIVVVMVLIALITAGVAAGINSRRQKAMHNLARAQVHQLAGKVEEYAIDNGSAPERIQDLVTKPGNARNWNGPYAKANDLKDPYGNDFVYAKPGQHGNDYDLSSLGADGQAGGESHNRDLTNWE